MPSEAHEQVVQLLLDNPTPSDTPIPDRRAVFDQVLSSVPVGEEVTTSESDIGGVAVDWVATPGASAERVVFVTHGGGYCMGSAETYREFASRLSRAGHVRVAVVDYRLGPESPFPAALDDCVAAYGGLLDSGVPGTSIVVAGDSGGAGLALAVVARVRDEGLEVPAAAVGFAPWLDLAVGDSIAEAREVGDPMQTPDDLRLFANAYLQGHAPTDPITNVLYGDLRGLPPLLLLAGTRDITYGDSLRLATLARGAGVSVTLKTFHGLIHNWQMFTQLPEAAEAVATMGEFVDEHLREPVTVTEESMQ